MSSSSSEEEEIRRIVEREVRRRRRQRRNGNEGINQSGIGNQAVNVRVMYGDISINNPAPANNPNAGQHGQPDEVVTVPLPPPTAQDPLWWRMLKTFGKIVIVIGVGGAFAYIELPIQGAVAASTLLSWLFGLPGYIAEAAAQLGFTSSGPIIQAIRTWCRF